MTDSEVRRAYLEAEALRVKYGTEHPVYAKRTAAAREAYAELRRRGLV